MLHNVTDSIWDLRKGYVCVMLKHLHVNSRPSNSIGWTTELLLSNGGDPLVFDPGQTTAKLKPFLTNIGFSFIFVSD